MTRSEVQQLANESVRRGDPTSWFEMVYARAARQPGHIPWVDLVPNPGLVEWARRTALRGDGRKALDVGCGLGDSSEHLASIGFDVTAFDISVTAIQWCRERFRSDVDYVVADLFSLPDAWRHAFDFVHECNNLQALPPGPRARAMAAIGSCVAPGGTLFVSCRGRQADEDPGRMPWPLTESDLQTLTRHGLERVSFDDYLDTETPPVRRFRAVFVRP